LHESNGKDGAESRSWNRCYTEIRFNVFDSLLVVTPKYWVPFIVEKENGNIDQYLGYGELKIEGSYWKHPDVLKLTVLLKKGANLDLRKGGVRVNLTWRPIQSFWPGFTEINPALYVQYWNGTGERLETFDIPTKSIRTGVIFAL
jgi:phospholipase A1/A2